jgi:hypothetical protein
MSLVEQVLLTLPENLNSPRYLVTLFTIKVRLVIKPAINNYALLLKKHLCCIMITVLDSSVIYRGFDPPLIQNKEPPSSPLVFSEVRVTLNS